MYAVYARYTEALPWLNVAYQMNDSLRVSQKMSSSLVALDARIVGFYRRQCLLVRLDSIQVTTTHSLPTGP